jgi:DNA-binding MarR family transcriptional regulator
MFTTEFLEDIMKRAARKHPGGDLRFRTLLEFLAVADAVRDRLRRTLAEHGCTELGFEVLTTLRAAEDGSLPPSVIADRTTIFRGTLTDVLAQLEAAGLIVRRRNESDRRQLLARLTPRGLERCEQIIEHYVEAILDSVRDLPRGSLSQLDSALAGLGRRVGAF